MTLGTKEIENNPQLIHEPCCGSGSNLIAMANAMKNRGFNYQKNAYFVAQAIDPTVAKMCYIQMSLLGIPGIVIVGNSLTNPMQGDYWFTPFHFSFGIFTLKRYRNQKKQMISESKSHNSHENDWLIELIGLA